MRHIECLASVIRTNQGEKERSYGRAGKLVVDVTRASTGIKANDAAAALWLWLVIDMRSHRGGAASVSSFVKSEKAGVEVCGVITCFFSRGRDTSRRRGVAAHIARVTVGKNFCQWVGSVAPATRVICILSIEKISSQLEPPTFALARVDLRVLRWLSCFCSFPKVLFVKCCRELVSFFFLN